MAPDQGQKIADLGEGAIDEAIDLYASSGIYQRATIIHACAGFIESEALGEKILRFLSLAAKQDGDILRDVVLKTLGKSGSPKSLPIINQYLKDPNVQTVGTAASALAMIDPNAAMTAVLSGKADGVGEEELLELIDDLHYSKQSLSDAQIAIFLSSDYPTVRLETLERLVAQGQLSDARLTELLEDSSPDVRSKALQLLVTQTKGGDLSELLLKCLHDKDQRVVDTARHLLSRSRKKLVPRLVVEAETASDYTLDALVGLLRDVQAPQLITKLGEVLKKKGRKQVRVLIVKWLMAQERPAEIMPYLETALQDQTAEVVDAALKALVAIGDNRAAKLLSLHLLTNRHGHPAERVMDALSHFSTSIFEPAVIGFLGQTEDVGLLWSALKMIKRHHMVSALPELRKMRVTAPPDHQEYLDEAIELLEGLGASESDSLPDENLAEFRSRLGGDDVESRLTTLDELPHPMNPTLIPDLEKMLFDNDRRIRSKTAGCLSRLNPAGIVEKIRDEFLFMSLKDKYKAAEALWILGDDSDHECVAGLLYDPRRKGVNPEIATMFKDRGMDEREIAQLTRHHQVKHLLNSNQPDSIEPAFDGTRDELIGILEVVLDEQGPFSWKKVFAQLKMLDWRPNKPCHMALLASEKEDPQVPSLDSDSSRWLGDIASMSNDARQLTRMLRVLARGGDQCKSTLLELVGEGRLGFAGKIAPDTLRLFTRDEILCLVESDSLWSAEFGLRVIANSDWSDKCELIESHLRLAVSNREEHIQQVASSLLFEVDQESAKALMLQILATGADGLSDSTRGHFAKLLGEMGGGETRLLLLGQLIENQPGASNAAYQSLVKMGWSPSTVTEKALEALYKPDHQAFETLGEEVLPQVLAFLGRGAKCRSSILSYILRVVPDQDLDRELVRAVLEGDWEYEAMYKELPKLLSRCPDIATDVLLELINKQREYSGQRIRFTEYLCAVCNNKAIPLFFSLLTSKSEHEIKLAAMALGRLRHGPAVPLLGATLPNIRDKATYSAIVKTIAAIGGEEAVNLLRPLLPELQTKVLRTAAEKAVVNWEKSRSKA
ncbi:MAG: HEAT repeat domain-containing protein [Candidatus Thiodiazotropha endolucinida]